MEWIKNIAFIQSMTKEVLSCKIELLQKKLKEKLEQ